MLSAASAVVAGTITFSVLAAASSRAQNAVRAHTIRPSTTVRGLRCTWKWTKRSRHDAADEATAASKNDGRPTLR